MGREHLTSVVTFNDSLDELFDDRPRPRLEQASVETWATPQYLPTGVNFTNPQGRRRPVPRKRPPPLETYAPVADETSYAVSTRVRWNPNWSLTDASLLSSGAATCRGRRGLEELRRMRSRQTLRDARKADTRETGQDVTVKTSRVAAHLMKLRAAAKEQVIDEQVAAWHARSPNKQRKGSGLFEGSGLFDVDGPACFGLDLEEPLEMHDRAPAPPPAPAPRERLCVMPPSSKLRIVPEHAWKRKDCEAQERAFKRRVGITVGPPSRTTYLPRARKAVGVEKTGFLTKLAEQAALAKASVGKVDPRTGEALVYYGTDRPKMF